MEIMVKFKPGVQVQSAIAQCGLKVKDVIPELGVLVCESEVTEIPGAEYVEVNDLYYPDTNDPHYPRQYGLRAIKAPEAWEISKGDPGVVIAILDTGIVKAHEDLQVTAHVNQSRLSDTPYDRHGHGTHVAGIAGAVTDNALGIAGVTWYCSLLNVKVLGDDGPGYRSDVVKGIVYAADNGANVINMSLGGPIGGLTIQRAVNYAYDKGVVLVASAGNTSGSIGYPAKYEKVIAVGATDRQNERVWFSSYGPELTIMAPGWDIYSTELRNRYAYKSGTSMAAPHVAGLASLMLSIRPNLTPQEVTDYIIEGANDLGQPGWDEYYGHGLIDCEKTLRLIEQLPEVPEPELPDMLIVGGTGVAVEFIRSHREEAGARIGTALQENPNNLYLRMAGSILNIRSREFDDPEDITWVEENLEGYYDGDGWWVSV